jgi:hypoxanthine phosphoribosyltransferase/DNA-binding HxlR family transcriptional regulator
VLTRDPELVEHGPQYLLGRLGSCLEATALASQRFLSVAFVESVLSHRNQDILQRLVMGEKRNVDLAREMGKSPEIVSRRLKELVATGVVVQRRLGREVTNRLTIYAHQVLAAVHTDTRISRQVSASVLATIDRVGSYEERWSWEDFLEKVGELANSIDHKGDIPDAIIGVTDGGQTVADQLKQRIRGGTCRTFALNVDRSEPGPNFDIPANRYLGIALGEMAPRNPLLVDDKCCSGVVLEAAKKYMSRVDAAGGLASLKTAVVVYAKNERIEPDYYAFVMRPKGNARGVLLPTSPRWAA